MKTYKFNIKEVFETEVYMDGNTPEEAFSKVSAEYEKGNIKMERQPSHCISYSTTPHKKERTVERER